MHVCSFITSIHTTLRLRKEKSLPASNVARAQRLYVYVCVKWKVRTAQLEVGSGKARMAMTPAHKLSEREPIVFILLLILLIVFAFGGHKKRQEYDAERIRTAQPYTASSDASQNGQADAASVQGQ